MAMLAWLPSRPTAVSVHSPLTVSRPRTVSPRSVKKAIVASRSRTAIPTFSSLMGMRGTLSTRDDLFWLSQPRVAHEEPDRKLAPVCRVGWTNSLSGLLDAAEYGARG